LLSQEVFHFIFFHRFFSWFLIIFCHNDFLLVGATQFSVATGKYWLQQASFPANFYVTFQSPFIPVESGKEERFHFGLLYRPVAKERS
jgi:hypothetical protein